MEKPLQSMFVIAMLSVVFSIYSCSCDLHQAPQWAIQYGTSQNPYQ